MDAAWRAAAGWPARAGVLNYLIYDVVSSARLPRRVQKMTRVRLCFFLCEDLSILSARENRVGRQAITGLESNLGSVGDCVTPGPRESRNVQTPPPGGLLSADEIEQN